MRISFGKQHNSQSSQPVLKEPSFRKMCNSQSSQPVLQFGKVASLVQQSPFTPSYYLPNRNFVPFSNMYMFVRDIVVGEPQAQDALPRGQNLLQQILQQQPQQQSQQQSQQEQEKKRKNEQELKQEYQLQIYRQEQHDQEAKANKELYRRYHYMIYEFKFVSEVFETMFDEMLYNFRAQSIENFESESYLNILTELVRTLNPHLETVTKQQIDSMINYQILKESLEPLAIQTKKQLQNETELVLQKVKSAQNTGRFEELSKENQTQVAMVLLYQHLNQNGHEVYISNQTHDKNRANILKKHKIVTSQQDEGYYLSIKFENISLRSFLGDQKKRDPLIKWIGQHHKINPEDILLVNSCKSSADSADLVFQVKAPPGGNVITPDIIGPFWRQHKVDYRLQSMNDVTIRTKSCVSNFIISPSFFIPEYNKYWDEYYINIVDYRGSIMFKNKGLVPQRYYFPVGYIGIAINVEEFTYRDTSNWFGDSEDPDTWIVLFHGSHDGGDKGIIEQKIINVASNDENANDCCLINGENIKPGNIYFVKKVGVSSGFNCVKFNGINYEFIYQCRVDPKVVRCVDNDDELFYLVNKEHQYQIRPYRFLIKQK